MSDRAATTPLPAAVMTGWQRLKRDRLAMAALVFLGIVFAACFVVPPFMGDWRNQPSDAVFMAPGTQGLTGTGTAGGVPHAPPVTFAWGTDANGRDVLFRVLSGGRVSLLVGLCAAAVSLFIGTVVGMTAGFLGGRVDAILMRGVDVLYALPRVLFVLVLIAALDEPIRSWLESLRDRWVQSNDVQPAVVAERLIPYSKTLILILCLGMIEWLTMARIVRGQVLVLKEQQFVAAARCLGQSRRRIMSRHLLPNLWTVILTYLTLTIPIVILDESFLSFLGLGIQEPAASWGALLKEGAASLNLIEPRWWLPVFPALAMALTLLALNFLGDSLRDAMDVH